MAIMKNILCPPSRGQKELSGIIYFDFNLLWPYSGPNPEPTFKSAIYWYFWLWGWMTTVQEPCDRCSTADLQLQYRWITAIQQLNNNCTGQEVMEDQWGRVVRISTWLQTDGRTDRRTDRQMDGRTDKWICWAVSLQLKISAYLPINC